MAIRKKQKKVVPTRRRFGLSAVPIEKGFDQVLYYFQTEMSNSDISKILKSYLKEKHKKSANLQYIMSCPEYHFYSHPSRAATAFWLTHAPKKDDDDKSKAYSSGLSKWTSEMISLGKEIYQDKLIKKNDSDARPSISPMERLKNKISNTIMQDLLELEDQWIDGEKTTIDVYSLLKKHGLAGSATLPVRQVIEGWLVDYEDAYHKRCDDAVEGYSHLKRPELNRRIKSCQEMLLDLDRIKSAAKATRKTKVKQPKAADKQVSKVQYKSEDSNFKLVSISPIQIIGKIRLYTFNTKSRMLTEYITQSVGGFEISGTTIKNIDTVNSRTVRLRKPDEFLPGVLTKTVKQIDTEWKKLTTKTTIPNGRLNSDTILLKVLDK